MGVKRSGRTLDAKTARLLDANLNRAREGLRVIEDAARFLWDDKVQYRRFRSMRHQLDEVTRVSYRDLVASRESRSDVGRTIIEGPRSSVSSVVAANVRRAQEAVRVLEEYSKVFSPAAAGSLKKIRYQLYQEEKKLLKRL